MVNRDGSLNRYWVEIETDHFNCFQVRVPATDVQTFGNGLRIGRY